MRMKGGRMVAWKVGGLGRKGGRVAMRWTKQNTQRLIARLGCYFINSMLALGTTPGSRLGCAALCRSYLRAKGEQRVMRYGVPH